VKLSIYIVYIIR